MAKVSKAFDCLAISKPTEVSFWSWKNMSKLFWTLQRRTVLLKLSELSTEERLLLILLLITALEVFWTTTQRKEKKHYFIVQKICRVAAQSYLFYDNLLSSSSSSENSRDVFHHFDRQPKSAKMSFHNLFRNCPSSGLVIFVVMSMWTPVSYCGFEKLLSSKFFKTFFPKKLCFKSIQG